MLSVIKWEMKKNFKPGILAVWTFGLLVSYVCIRTDFSINDVYADVFNKYYGLAPIMGIIIFTMFSGSFIQEYNSNIDGLIKASKNGKKQLVLSKFIANGICASIVNLSILGLMAGKAVTGLNFKGLDLPLQQLWYFGNSGSNLTVLQMLLVVSLTVILGSFLFASIGLYLSSISKKATLPFIFGGLIMGAPYLVGGWIPNEVAVNLPIWGMYSQQLIRYKAPIASWGIFVAISVVTIVVLYNLSKKSFLKEI